MAVTIPHLAFLAAPVWAIIAGATAFIVGVGRTAHLETLGSGLAFTGAITAPAMFNLTFGSLIFIAACLANESNNSTIFTLMSRFAVMITEMISSIYSASGLEQKSTAIRAVNPGFFPGVTTIKAVKLACAFLGTCLVPAVMAMGLKYFLTDRTHLDELVLGRFVHYYPQKERSASQGYRCCLGNVLASGTRSGLYDNFHAA